MRAKTKITYNRDGFGQKNREQRRSDPSTTGRHMSCTVTTPARRSGLSSAVFKAPSVLPSHIMPIRRGITSSIRRRLCRL